MNKFKSVEVKCKVNAVYIHNQLYKALDSFNIDSDELQIEHMAQIISDLSNELSSKLYRDTGYKMGQATNEHKLLFNNDHL